MSTEQREVYDPGIILWSAPRGQDGAERLRLTKREYLGKQFFDLRVEYRGQDGRWLPTKKGISLRLGEVDAFVDALRGAT